VVRRTQFADSQTKKQAWQRRKNVEGVFQLTCANKIEGKHLLIVDDVVTTGSTVIACAQTLCQADQVRISVLSIGITS
jgi:predicted amidophosphoribosyltransferase